MFLSHSPGALPTLISVGLYFPGDTFSGIQNATETFISTMGRHYGEKAEAWLCRSVCTLARWTSSVVQTSKEKGDQQYKKQPGAVIGISAHRFWWNSANSYQVLTKAESPGSS